MSAWKKHYRRDAYLLQFVFFGGFILSGLFGLPLEGLRGELGEVSQRQSQLMQDTHFKLEERFYEWVSAARLT